MRDWLSHRAAATPGATALRTISGERAIDYAEFDRAVDRTAGRLAALGVGEGDHLGVVLPRRITTVRLFWAAMRLGAVTVPLSPEWDAATLGERAERVDVTTLVCGASTEARAAATDLPAVSVDATERESVPRLDAEDAEPVAPTTWVRSDTMTINFTAGTAEAPKPVVLRMGNHLTSAADAAFRFGIAPTDRWLVTHPLHHVCGFGPALRAALYGSTLLVPDSLDPGALADALATHDATGVSVSPSRLEAMLDARGTLPESLRVVLVCGAPAPAELLDRCRGYSIPAYSAYTLTEVGGEVAAAPPAVSGAAKGSVGRPMLRADVTVVGDDGESVGAGETGELVVSGPAVSPGYYDPAAGGAVSDPDSERGVATGDLGYRDGEGRLWVTARKADVTEVDGEPVRATDVADVLESHEGVAAAAAAGVPGDGGREVGALVVRNDPDLDAATLRAHCRERLADFVAPDRIAFAPSLPRSASGAVSRLRVRDRLADAGNPPYATSDPPGDDPPADGPAPAERRDPGIGAGRDGDRGGTAGDGDATIAPRDADVGPDDRPRDADADGDGDADG